jgi:hypothetical protein
MLCVTPEGLQQICEAALRNFDRRLVDASESCLQFNLAASTLEAELKQSYRFMASMARQLEDLDQIARLWDAFVVMCDKYAEKLRSLDQAHPFCGADQFYDRVLDLRNKSQRLADLHR